MRTTRLDWVVTFAPGVWTSSSSGGALKLVPTTRLARERPAPRAQNEFARRRDPEETGAPPARRAGRVPPGMRVRVLFFARARELAGAGEAAVELEEGATAATLLEALEAQVRHGVVGVH